MTPSEVIEEIKRLPDEGKRQVKQFVQNLETDSSAVKYIPKDEFRRATKEVFAEYNELFKKLAQ